MSVPRSESDVGFHVLVARALDDDDNPLWPERFPREVLLQYRKEAGALIFALQYQNDASAAGGGLVRSEHLRFWDDLPRDATAFIGVDPAPGTSPNGDFFAVAVVTQNAGGLFVKEVFQARLDITAQVETVARMTHEHRAACVAVEAVAYQSVLVDLLRKAGLPARPVHPRRAKEWRFARLAALAETGALLLGRSQKQLLEQLLLWPDCEHDDLLDALWLAIEATRRGRASFLSLPGV